MRTRRRALRRSILAWLIYQLCALTLIPAALCVEMPTASAQTACTCAQGDGHECPMHHKSANSKSCSCRSTTETPDAAIRSLSGPVAVLPPMIDAVEAIVTSECSWHPTSSVFDSPRVPDAPPPRG